MSWSGKRGPVGPCTVAERALIEAAVLEALMWAKLCGCEMTEERQQAHEDLEERLSEAVQRVINEREPSHA